MGIKDSRYVDFRITRKATKIINELPMKKQITTSYLFRVLKMESYVISMYVFDDLVAKKVITKAGAIIR